MGYIDKKKSYTSCNKVIDIQNSIRFSEDGEGGCVGASG